MIYLSVVVILSSCSVKNESSNSSEIKKVFNKVEAIGKLKNGSYIFCGIIPTEVNYTYRTGKWEFITKGKIKIAEGVYDVIIKKNDSSGGCGFEYFENTVDLRKWKFWNKDGKLVKPTKQLMKIIESNQTELSVHLE